MSTQTWPSEKFNLRCLKRGALVLMGFLVILGGVYWRLSDNIHTVIPGQVYRSAQLSGASLKQLVQARHIRTVINLRGQPKHAKDWYREEVQASQQLGIQHFDVGLNAKKLPRGSRLKQLVHLLQDAPRPILLHCKSGADRTGLAAAFADLLLGPATLAQADAQISYRYGAISPKTVGRQVMPLYQQWLNQKHAINSRAQFLSWIAQLPDGKMQPKALATAHLA